MASDMPGTPHAPHDRRDRDDGSGGTAAGAHRGHGGTQSAPEAAAAGAGGTAGAEGAGGAGGGFDALASAYLEELFADRPSFATFHGWEGLDDRSPDLGADAIADRERRADRWLARFDAFDDAALTPEQRIDRDLVVSVLRGDQLMRDWQDWRRNPDTYLGPALMGVFSLFLRRGLPEPELVQAAEARLRAVPALLEAGRANLDPALASAILARRGQGQCQAGVTYARDLVPAEVDDPALRARLAEAGEVAAGAFAAFGAFLDELAVQATGEWAIGEARYSGLLREAELLSFDAAGLHDRGDAAWAELDAEMTALARVADPDTASDGGWPAVVAACGENRPATPDEMRDAYDRETARTRAFLVDHQLVTLPDGERCEVVPSPPFQRPVLAVASYFQPPAFKPSRTGRFNVPYPPDGTPPDEVAKRLADNGHHSIPTITAHEAYPGHHWHLTTMGEAPPLRRVHRSAYFTEGWALYAERVMREHGYFADPRDELLHLNARIFRAARIVVDTALHSGDMTVDEAIGHMQRRAGLTEPVARAEVHRYCAWPTQAASYLTGCLEIERLRDRWRAEGRGDLRRFHDTLAATGGLPMALAERATFA
jgi:uncharacterized protein (DUF885 family)